jgi:DNA-binding transcriptional regulator YhcF (GntR family)
MAQVPAPELAPDLARSDDLPVGAQLAWRLRALIASRQIGPGDRLPGVRELASGAGVNVNTARAVYRRLEEDGLIVSRHGLGTFVSEDAPASPELERLAAEAADSARASGIDPRDLARAIYAGSGPGLPHAGPFEGSSHDVSEVGEREGLPAVEGDERLGRRELRRQIARLEAQLASYPADSRKPGEPTHPLLRPKGHVAGMAELEAIRDELMERLQRAREAAERRGERQRRARSRVEEMVSDPAAHKWETVSKRDLGEPGCASWEVQPRWGPVGALMNWWRVKVSSGCPLARPHPALA